MKILWILNTILPYPAQYFNLPISPFGGWLIGMLNQFKKESTIQLAVVSFYKGNELLKCSEDNVIYYLFPKKNLLYDDNLKIYYQQVVEQFKPEIVHIHGTEYANGLVFLKNFKEITSIISLQGIMKEISKNYLAGLSKKEILYNITLRDIIKNDTIFAAQKKFYDRANYENEMLSSANYIIGRTDWDKNFCKKNFSTLDYYKCNENLRDCFYDNQTWNLNKVERHSIMFSQITYPLKGFHILLKSLSILKGKYPDVKIYVTGQNILSTNTFKEKLKLSGYARYLKKLIKKYKLHDNIIFCGMCNEHEIRNIFLKANIFVQASIIENSSNALGEAMILGVPCVVSDVGGTRTIITDQEGIIYESNNVNDLAKSIEFAFENDEFCLKLSKNARKKALVTHDRYKNYETLINIYHDILEKGGK